MRAQFPSFNRKSSRRYNIANKLTAPTTLTARNNRRLRYTRVTTQRSLNLPRLNAETTNLDLMVRAPDKLQYSIPAPARQVPAAVHPTTRSPKPVRNKALPSQPATTKIAATNPPTGYVKLPNYPNRYRLQAIIQYIDARVPNRTTNRRRLRLIVVQKHERRPDRSFRRPVEIPNLTAETAQGRG